MMKFSSSLRRGLTLGTLAIALAGGVGAAAFAAPHGGGHWGGGGPGMMMGGRGMERMLDSVNASAEQRAQIKRIVDAARADLQGQREQHRALRAQAMQIFTQPTVDANAAEQLRQQMMAQHDQASRRMTQAMVEVSRVLTPEQRKQLADRMAQRLEMMKRHQQERQQLEQSRPRS